MNEIEEIEKLEVSIGYKFKNRDLIKEALTHSSYANEKKINKSNCNERLEFLGDAVLEMVSSDYLFRKYSNLKEGELSKLRARLVCEPALAKSASMIDLGNRIFLGRGEEAGGGRLRDSVTSDAFEAVIGAMYLDSGIDDVTSFIMKYVLCDTDEYVNVEDSKSRFQEKVQSIHKKAVISYEVIEERGPEHCKEFVVAVYVDGKMLGEGTGRSKKAAEKQAAKIAIDNI